MTAPADQMAAPRPGSRLVAYLLVARPQDLMVKTSFVLVAYLAGRWASSGTGLPVWAAALAIVALELLAYQARYMINDVLDATHDAHHPAVASRRRIPNGQDRRIQRIVLGAAAGRVLAAVVACLVLPGRARPIGLTSIGLVFVVAAVYEWLRRALRRPVPLEVAGRLDWVCAATFVTVGAGYAVRVATGLALAGAPGWSLVPGAVFGWLLGVVFISMTWVLEGSSFITADWAGVDDHLLRKRHLAVCLRFAGLFPPDPASWSGSPLDARVLGPPSPWTSPWAVAALPASVVAAALGLLLANEWAPHPGLWPAAAASAMAAAATVAALRLPTPTLVVAAGCSAGLVAALVGIAALEGLPKPGLAAVPAVLLVAAVLVFRGFSYSAMLGFGARSSSRSTDTPSSGES